VNRSSLEAVSGTLLLIQACNHIMSNLLRRRDIRDAIVIFVITLIAFVYADYYDLSPKIFQLALDYADWEVDNLILMSVVSSIALIIYGFRRNQDLSSEIKARRSAELEARNNLVRMRA